MSKSLTIRFATIEDTELILYFIKSLAAYEKMSEQVITTKSLLEKSLFVDKHAEVILAFLEKKPIGFALFFHTFSTFQGTANLYLEDLFIEPTARGYGYGKAMLKFLTEVALKRKCKRLEWVCLDWNKTSIAFYKKLGAKALDDWTTYRLDTDAMKNLIK